MKDRCMKRLQKNDKGFSIVMVIIAIAFVSILGIIVLWIALQNLWTKKVTLDSDKNFYTAETALDEVRTGLQSNISSAASKAYIYVMQHYSETEGNDTTRNWYFETRYVDNLKAQLQSTSDSSQYDINKLQNYLVTTAWNEGNNTGAKITSDNAQLVTNYTDGVTVKNLTVTYTDSAGYVSKINTDLNLVIPSLDFTQSSSTPDILQYCLVANDKLVIESNADISTATGSLYAGPGGIDMQDNSNFEVSSDGGRVVSCGPVVTANDSKFDTVGTGAFWAKSLTMNGTGGVMTLRTRTFVADDLTINGSGNTVTLGSKNSKGISEGTYCGFSNPESVKASLPYLDTGSGGPYIKAADVSADPAAYSSAIIVNGQNTTIDMSNLTSLILAGNSYISTRIDKITDSKSKTEIGTGESLSVKSGQLAYLAPADCIELVTVNNGTTTTTSNTAGNPVIISTGTTTPTVQLKINDKVTALGGATLASFGLTAESCQPVFFPDGETTLIYVYLKFPSDTDASRYFQAYYHLNSSYLDQYYGFYLNGISINSNISTYTTFTTNGNILMKNSLIKENASSKSGTTDEQAQYQNMFYALSKKLINNYSALSESEKASGNWIFENILLRNAAKTGTLLEDFVKNSSSSVPIGSDGSSKLLTFQTKAAGQKLCAKLIAGDYTVTSVTDANTRLIIATGTITFESGSFPANAPFTGTVIAGKDVIIGNGVHIESAPSDVATVYQCVFDVNGNKILDTTGAVTGKAGTEVAPMDFFVNGASYIFSGSTKGNAASGAVSGKLDFAKLVVYQNWKKE